MRSTGRSGEPRLVKKYGNRRLYDTEESTYITVEELAELVRSGVDVRVIEASSGAELTQSTLLQVLLEGRGAARMLSPALLTQLIRLGDDALAEFFGRYISATLDWYLRGRRFAEAVAPVNPLVALPFAASDAFARWFAASGLSGAPAVTPPLAASLQPPMPPVATLEDVGERAHEGEVSELSAMRKELAALRKEVEQVSEAARATRKPVKKK